VALRDDLNSYAPQLCRYARALAAGHPAPNETADALVRAVLLRASEAESFLPRPELHLHLYSLLTEWHRETLTGSKLQTGTRVEKENSFAGGPRAAGKLPPSGAARGQLAGALLSLPLEEREALLLVVLEGFSYAQAARILKISQTSFVSRLSRARRALGNVPMAGDAQLPAKRFPSYLRVVK
jgi:RNA polymerase sigma-70 factor (ECF subfamily)